VVPEKGKRIKRQKREKVGLFEFCFAQGLEEQDGVRHVDLCGDFWSRFLKSLFLVFHHVSRSRSQY
jgi:hypothetical protein